MISRLKVMRIFSLVLALCVCSVLIPVSAATQLPFTLAKVDDDNSIIVECALTTAVANRDVTFYLLKPGYDYRQLDSDTANGNYEGLVDMQVIATGADGRARYSYLMPDDVETGWYTVLCSVYGVYATSTIEVFFASMLAKQNAVDAANAANTIEAMAAAVDTYNLEFRITDTYSIYSGADSEFALRQQHKNFVCSKLIAARNASSFTTTVDFRKAFEEAVAIAAVNNAGNTKVYPALKRVKDYLVMMDDVKLDFTAYDSYREADKLTASKIMYNRGFETVEEIFEAHDATIALMAVNTATWSELGPHKVSSESKDGVLKDYNHIFELDFEGKYAQIKDKAPVYKGLMSSPKFPYLTVEDLRSEFDRIVNKVYNDEKSGGGSGGGGGGGSSSGSKTEVIYSNPAAPVVPAQLPFPDLGGVEWAVESITALYQKGIVAGDGGLFKPNDNVTREQFIKMLVMAFGFFDATADTSLTDLDKNAWYYSYVASAEKAGITNGMGDGTFGVGNNITRQQMATMAYRAALTAGKNLAVGAAPQFTDSDSIDDYAREAIAAMQNAGIISGMGDGSFAPNATATRAQAAKIINALMNL